MKTLILAALLVAGSIHAEIATLIPSNARIYVEPASGFDAWLTAALAKKHVPLTVTTDKSKADYEIEAGVRLVDLKSGDVILACPVGKNSTPRGQRNAALACARLLGSATSLHPSEFSARKTTVKRLQGWPFKDPAFDF